jgi:phage antirepressor YoqD-like protein
MTISEIALVLGVSRDLIEKRVNELFPDKMKKGVTTYLSEAEVTMVKMRIQQNSSLATSDDHRRLADMPSTELEMMILDQRISEWKTRKIHELQSQLETAAEKIAIDAPKVESFDALQRSESAMSITTVSRMFNLHPRIQVFPYLKHMEYLTKKGLPTRIAIEAGYLAQREQRGADGIFRPVAVVLGSQLETWRRRVVPQIAAWEADRRRRQW